MVRSSLFGLEVLVVVVVPVFEVPVVDQVCMPV